MSKITSGKMDLHLSSHDVNKIAKNVLERYQDDPRLQIDISKFESEAPLMIECDEYRIEQVLTNLISNALKYGKNNPVEVDLIEGHDTVTIVVKDQGVGISSDDIQRIFDRFERVGHNIGISGLGLGLYICKNIIDAHGGKILVESEVDHWTVFKVELKKKINH